MKLCGEIGLSFIPMELVIGSADARKVTRRKARTDFMMKRRFDWQANRLGMESEWRSKSARLRVPAEGASFTIFEENLLPILDQAVLSGSSPSPKDFLKPV